jgi:hypothetical protein
MGMLEAAPAFIPSDGEILSTFGDDGWELVSVAQIENPMGGKSLVGHSGRSRSQWSFVSRRSRRPARNRSVRPTTIPTTATNSSAVRMLRG